MTTKSDVVKEDRAISLAYIEWYTDCSKRKGGYYDQYKNCHPSKIISPKTISVEVASSKTTIGNLKTQIQDKVGVPQFQQWLFFDGRHLDNMHSIPTSLFNIHII